MFSFSEGKSIAKIKGGKYNNSIIHINDNDEKTKGNFKEININDGKIEPIPDIEKRQCSFIAGPSGSGKSTMAANYLEKYKKIFPDNKIIIFSRKDSDPVLDKIKPLHR